MTSGDDYASAAKPQIDWDDKDAQADLVDSRAKDAYACLAHLDGSELARSVEEAARLLATVVGQDLEVDGDGTFRIARKVATDRVISVVDPETRHGHKTQAKGFDGYKGHVGIDPDSEIITATTVTPGNAGDAGVAEELISDLLDDTDADTTGEKNGTTADNPGDLQDGDETTPATTVYGDNAYGTGPFQRRLEDWPGRAPARSTSTGSPTTGPPGRRSSARSRISCAASTAVDGPGCAAGSGSPPTSSSSPPPSIWRASGRSTHSPPTPGGEWQGREEPRMVTRAAARPLQAPPAPRVDQAQLNMGRHITTRSPLRVLGHPQINGNSAAWTPHKTPAT
ncbi:MAG TPA: transposase [Acidimicrobiales bacterium]|nr:transposase [Acidimicrobiales bacterium]